MRLKLDERVVIGPEERVPEEWLDLRRSGGLDGRSRGLDADDVREARREQLLEERSVAGTDVQRTARVGQPAT